METPPPPSSPYRVGNWTITQLKEELKQRNLSPAGRKQELIERLERFEDDHQMATPRHARKRTMDKYQNYRRYACFYINSSDLRVGIVLGVHLAKDQ